MKTKHMLVIILLLAILVLASITCLSSYTRMHADDFCIGADAQSMSPFSYFQKWYDGWTGRFAYISLVGLLALGGVRLAALLPSATLVLFLFFLAWAIFPLFRHKWIEKPLLWSISLAATFLQILFSSTPNLYQSLFWRDGLVNYTFPLVGFAAVCGFLIRNWLEVPAKKWRIFPIFLISFLSGGFSELFTAIQVSVYALLILLFLLVYRQEHKPDFLYSLLAALLGALIALSVVYLAPGNAVRQGIMAETPAFVRLVTFSIRNAAHITAKFFIQTPVWAWLTFVSALWMGLSLARAEVEEQSAGQIARAVVPAIKKLFLIMLIPFMTFIIMVAACAPVVYGLNAYPDDRSIYLPLAVLVSGMMLWVFFLTLFVYRGGRLSNILHNSLTYLLITALMLVSVLGASVFRVAGSIRQVPDYQAYASAWDARDEELREQADQNIKQVTVRGLDSRFGLADLREEGDYWVNACMAAYYGIPIIFGR